MRVRFTAPSGWIRQAFPPPQRGVYLRAPVAAGSADSASILLLDAVVANGKLEEQLGSFVDDGCRDGTPGGKGKAAPFKSKAGPGASIAVTVKFGSGGFFKGAAREEQRIFAVVDAGERRLPLVFLGAPKAPRAPFDALLGSIEPMPAQDELFLVWVG
jgi:hypothetical protein